MLIYLLLGGKENLDHAVKREVADLALEVKKGTGEEDHQRQRRKEGDLLVVHQTVVLRVGLEVEKKNLKRKAEDVDLEAGVMKRAEEGNQGLGAKTGVAGGTETEIAGRETETEIETEIETGIETEKGQVGTGKGEDAPEVDPKVGGDQLQDQGVEAETETTRSPKVGKCSLGIIAHPHSGTCIVTALISL